MKKVYQVIASSALAAMLTMNVGSGMAWADENKQVTSQTIETGEDEQITESPVVLPGDFFYFFKSMLEEIQLALTFNDLEKAQLIAEIAEERIKEAAALIKEGEEATAKEVLLRAVENQELALTYHVEEGSEQDDPEQEKLEQVVTAEKETAEVETAEEETNEADSFEEESELVQDQKGSIDDESTKEIDSQLAQNLETIHLVLINFEDEEMKQDIQKDLAKLTKKLNHKMEKLLAADNKYDEKVMHIEFKQEAGQISQEEAEQKIAKEENQLTKKQVKISEQASKDFEKFNKETEKAQNKQVKNEKKKNEEMKNRAEKKHEKKKNENEKKRENMKKMNDDKKDKE